ncbi:hypothetical protein BVY02_02000 [bacterium J17]|nr:hypothetical protein BVY02_02000 [bacterium J17]
MADIVDEGPLSSDSDKPASKVSVGPETFMSAEDEKLESCNNAAPNLADIDFECGKLVSARGTEEGLILRIDGRADWPEIVAEIEGFLGGKESFFQGSEISIEWLDRLPTKEQSGELETLLRDTYSIEVTSGRRRAEQLAKENAKKTGIKKKGDSSAVTIPLFEEFDASSTSAESRRADYTKGLMKSMGLELDSFTGREKGATGPSNDAAESFGTTYLSRMSNILSEEVHYDEDANARVVFGTMRSGQRVETPFSLIVIGDVNPGADLIAGGDIIVVGSLRGTAHASAYDEEAHDRVIIALNMQPMQLRIGAVISRGSDEKVDGAEIARIENRRIIVEAFNPRMFAKNPLR